MLTEYNRRPFASNRASVMMNSKNLHNNSTHTVAFRHDQERQDDENIVSSSVATASMMLMCRGQTGGDHLRKPFVSPSAFTTPVDNYASSMMMLDSPSLLYGDIAHSDDVLEVSDKIELFSLAVRMINATPFAKYQERSLRSNSKQAILHIIDSALEVIEERRADSCF